MRIPTEDRYRGITTKEMYRRVAEQAERDNRARALGEQMTVRRRDPDPDVTTR